MYRSLLLLSLCIPVIVIAGEIPTPVQVYGLMDAQTPQEIHSSNGALHVVNQGKTLFAASPQVNVTCPICPMSVCQPPDYECCINLMPPVEVLAWQNLAVTVTNATVTNIVGYGILNSILVEFSPDKLNWEIIDKSLSMLPPGETRSIAFPDNGRRFVRVRAGSCAPLIAPAKAIATITANNG